MKRRIMVIGPTGSGKTTLCHALDEVDKPLKKTQDMMFGEHTIDVPGSYLDNPWMYKHLIAAAQNCASQVVMLVSTSEKREFYPPGYANVFQCPVIGVIMKSDSDRENIQRCRDELLKAGVKLPLFYVAGKEDKVGIEKIRKYLFDRTLNGENV